VAVSPARSLSAARAPRALPCVAAGMRPIARHPTELPRRRAYAEICRCARHRLPCPLASARLSSASCRMVAARCPKELAHILQRAGGVWEPGSRRWLVDRRRIVPVIRARITLGIPGRLHRNPQMAMNWFDVPDGVTATVSRPAARSAGPPDHHARSHRHLALTATSARRGSGRRCRWRGRRSLLGKGAAAWKARRRPKLSLDRPAITTGQRNQAHCGRPNVNPP
jgi:hypothetical protein